MSLLDTIKSFLSGGSSADAHDHAGHDHDHGHDHAHGHDHEHGHAHSHEPTTERTNDEPA